MGVGFTTSLRRPWICLASMASIGAALILLGTPLRKSSAQPPPCWWLRNYDICYSCPFTASPCSGTPCTIPWFTWVCPDGTNEVVRVAPAGIIAPGCTQVVTGQGQQTCSDTVPPKTSWCSTTRHCLTTCVPHPVTGQMVCESQAPGTMGSSCGFSWKALTGANCY